ncbi:hypothetical protein PB2503_08019 [Parvularcula bermudensis HTCC2503]|uniref:Uracil-DNA glycosylase-like domain-containing protein n=1 Tax=Parvularcula bermudensis (strain ATCC BAA-594 / HTCC2503 / KCTC 12087) TaxID=314260 RepID=E0TH75_PARBH|nr:hypothetical protein PB2503_08019 [Parvularcula bermudensis HTCC2503]
MTARIGVFSQAPGNLAHQGGKPFLDPSGDRLRRWMGLTEDQFYGSGLIAIVPMAFCFPGYDGTGPTGRGGDRPPPRICAEKWRNEIMAMIDDRLEIVLLIGRYAQEWHLGKSAARRLSDAVGQWPSHFADADRGGELILPMPHPSWRNTAWLKRHPWFEAEVIPRLQRRIADVFAAAGQPLTAR